MGFEVVAEDKRVSKAAKFVVKKLPRRRLRPCRRTLTGSTVERSGLKE